MQPQRPTSGLAVTALVFACISFLFVPLAPVALILGICAIIQVRRSRGELGGDGLAIAATAISGFLMLMLPIFAAILLPVFASARENARRASCESNLKQIGLAVIQYEQDWDQKLPMNTGPRYWDGAIFDYIKSGEGYKRPDDNAGLMSYMFNNSGGLLGANIDAIVLPAGTIMVGENQNAAYTAYTSAAKGYGPTCRVSAGNYGPANQPSSTANTSQNAVHSGSSGSNYVFTDGHEEYYQYNSSFLQQPPGSTSGGPWLP